MHTYQLSKVASTCTDYST